MHNIPSSGISDILSTVWQQNDHVIIGLGCFY